MAKITSSKKSFWESAGVKIGVISGAIGIVLSLLSFFNSFKHDSKKELEIKELALKLKDLEPRIEVAYVDVVGDLYSLSKSGDSLADSKEIFFLDYPIQDNEISGFNESGLNVSNIENVEVHTVYLMLENKGKTAPLETEVVIDRVGLNSFLKVNEHILDANYDFNAEVKSKAVSQSRITIKLPINLETGKGILIPIMIAEMKPRYLGPSKDWNIVSKIVYLPKLVKFKNSITDKVIEDSIRQMTNPLRLSEGVEIRG